MKVQRQVDRLATLCHQNDIKTGKIIRKSLTTKPSTRQQQRRNSKARKQNKKIFGSKLSYNSFAATESKRNPSQRSEINRKNKKSNDKDRNRAAKKAFDENIGLHKEIVINQNRHLSSDRMTLSQSRIYSYEPGKVVPDKKNSKYN